MNLRMYSTAEAEYAACAETLKFAIGKRELINFITGKDDPDGPVWIDNRSAMLTARHADVDLADIRAKSRHYALRHARVTDNKDRLFFTPTAFMRADPLTKLQLEPGQRELLFNLNSVPKHRRETKMKALSLPKDEARMIPVDVGVNCLSSSGNWGSSGVELLYIPL